MNAHPANCQLRASWITLNFIIALILQSFIGVAPPLHANEASNASEAVAAREIRERQLHLAALGVDFWHQAGARGQGTKVAILDSGFRGYRSFLGHGLPDQIKVRSFRKDGNLEAKNSQHGILCGEVVHALAPGAELLFANWEPDSPQHFLDAIRWARHEGARVITCSVIMPTWSDGEGGGKIHADLKSILTDDQNSSATLCFAAAGNTARRHWNGQFHDGGNGFHEWQAGIVGNHLEPWGDERVSIDMCWKEGADYQLLICDRENGSIVAESVAKASENRNSATVRFEPQSGRSYEVRARLLAGQPSSFHCVALHSGLECSTAAGSICFPADGAEVIAVGAVDADGRRQSYSACGPNSLQPKPDLVAPVPIGSLCRHSPFGGTSAATPQAAAVAALFWSRHPDWTADQVRSALCKAARDLGSPGHDCETGYGLIQLPDLQFERPKR